MRIANDLTELIGNTPLLDISKLGKAYGARARILAKLESFNPLGSAKDRAVLYMLNDAKEKGLLDENTVIIEPTSGNTGIGLAYICSIMGYKLMLTMPETMSEERKKILRFLGAELVLTDGVLGMNGAIQKAEELASAIPNAFIPGQFDNPANALAHKMTTGPEIWRDTDGQTDYFIAGIGTGGTISGTAEYLKKVCPAIKIIGVEPAESAVLSGGEAGQHKIQGIGAGFIPKVLRREFLDEVFPVPGDEAIKTAKECAKVLGVLCGISSGAAVYAAIQTACRKEAEGKTIVVLLPDTGERYISTELFE